MDLHRVLGVVNHRDDLGALELEIDPEKVGPSFQDVCLQNIFLACVRRGRIRGSRENLLEISPGNEHGSPPMVGHSPQNGEFLTQLIHGPHFLHRNLTRERSLPFERNLGSRLKIECQKSLAGIQLGGNPPFGALNIGGPPSQRRRLQLRGSNACST